MTRRAFGMPCSLPSDGVITPPAGKPPGPGPSGGHEKHPGLAAMRLTFVFQRSGKRVRGHLALEVRGTLEVGGKSIKFLLDVATHAREHEGQQFGERQVTRTEKGGG